jgi:hypothetical protein
MVALRRSTQYFLGVVDFGEDWANLMEKSGKPVSQCADRLERTADTDGITGFMYKCVS